MNKTGQGLADYAIAQLGRPYWWGTFGQRATPALLAQKRQQYPEAYGSYGSECAKHYGERVHDCVGLIKGYLWSAGVDSVPMYNSCQDVTAAGLYSACSKTGAIASLPEEAGVCVFMKDLSHVGVYVGGGEVVEAAGHAKGVVKSRLAQRGWAYWGKPRWISYDGAAQPADAAKNELPELGLGSAGEYVRSVQLLLIGRGYSCGSSGADGEFGICTEFAAAAYQREHGLEPDGIVGVRTWKRLLGG